MLSPSHSRSESPPIRGKGHLLSFPSPAEMAVPTKVGDVGKKEKLFFRLHALGH